jgi:hypothetical protein
VHRAGFKGETRPGYQETLPGHRNAWVQRAVKGFTERVCYGRSGRDSGLRKEVQPVRSGWLDGGVVMIGSVPCKLSSEVHVNDDVFSRPKTRAWKGKR